MAPLLGALLFASCSESAPEHRPNLLIIAVDTLRADHLGAYGYERNTSPHTDQFLHEAVLFEDAHSTSAWTLPSFASLMTSTYSSTNQCWQFDSQIDPSFMTLAEVLADAGYFNGAVLSHVFLGSKYGFAQGFDQYDETLVFDLEESHEAISSPPVTEKALAFLDERSAESSERPWFLFVHYFDPHYVYKHHDEVSSEFDTEEKVDLYDGEIAFTDLHIKQLLARLDKLGLRDDTVVAFVADHGEELYDHGKRGHGRTLYREIEHIPFAIRAPGMSARRVAASVSGVDFMPTILELLDVAPPEAPLAGRSLVGAMRGEALVDRGILLESRLNFRKDANLEAYIRGRWKLIVETPKSLTGEPIANPEPRLLLFDRVDDPTEQKNLIAEHPTVGASLWEELRAAVAVAEKLAAVHSYSGTLELSAEELERLRGLGYVGDDE